MRKDSPILFLFSYILVVGLVFPLFLLLASHYFFEPWKSYGKPIEAPKINEKADHILAANTDVLIVGTNLKNAYQLVKNRSISHIYTWNQVPYNDKMTASPSVQYGCFFQFWVPPLFKRIVAQSEDIGCRGQIGMGITKHVIDQEGIVWVWQRSIRVNEQNNILNSWYVQLAWWVWLLGGPLILIVKNGFLKLKTNFE